MNILIVGAGMVGFKLAKTLSQNNNVILLDKNVDALEKIQENLDVLVVSGNAEDPKSYKNLENIDIFIAVTDSDEINLISLIIASQKIDIKKKIIRLEKDFFAQSKIASTLDISDSIFPYMITVDNILQLLKHPKANNVKTFPNTKNKLISFHITNDIHELSVYKINTLHIKVVGIDNGSKLIIPKGDDRIKKGDMIYLFGDENEIEEISSSFNNLPNKIKNIAIFSADILGIELAKQLSLMNVNVKMIEKDIDKCNAASEILKDNVTIINTQYSDFRFYDDEGIKNADIIIATSKNGESNIIKCIDAKKRGIGKVISINNDLEYYQLMHSLGVTALRGPKINTYYTIIERVFSDDIADEKLFCGGSGICFTRIVSDAKKNVEPINIDGVLTFIVEDEKIFEFHTKSSVKNGMVISFGKVEKEEDVKRWIHNL